ncbi:hypothetical protein [Pleionea sediminis]|uniref:hypothetical protein n=1 Tax=Pleionea sediminis TaxID=2569479 RepID=UPI001184D267|nr:hypothetical protein [Pleionea sediminis]
MKMTLRANFFLSSMFGVLILAGCANQSALDVTRMLFGYIEPPKAESVMDSMKREYNRCLAIDSDRDCVQIAYDKVRVTQGLDPKPIPKGYVVIVQEEMNKPASTEESESDPE